MKVYFLITILFFAFFGYSYVETAVSVAQIKPIEKAAAAPAANVSAIANKAVMIIFQE